MLGKMTLTLSTIVFPGKAAKKFRLPSSTVKKKLSTLFCHRLCELKNNRIIFKSCNHFHHFFPSNFYFQYCCPNYNCRPPWDHQISRSKINERLKKQFPPLLLQQISICRHFSNTNHPPGIIVNDTWTSARAPRIQQEQQHWASFASTTSAGSIASPGPRDQNLIVGQPTAPPKFSGPYSRLIRLDKPIGTWLLFWPGAWAIALAAGQHNTAGTAADVMAIQQLPLIPTTNDLFSVVLGDSRLIALFAVGSFCMRSAGCVINDLWDRRIDSRVHRTKDRPLASGELSPIKAFYILSALLTGALSLLLQLDPISVCIGASALPLVCLYPLAKRFTNWPQLVLGLTFNWGALLGHYSAVVALTSANQAPTMLALMGFSFLSPIIFPFMPIADQICSSVFQGLQYLAPVWDTLLQALPLYAACVCWTLIYDTVYAHQDKRDDVLVGVQSTALLFGPNTRRWLTGFSVSMIGGLVISGWQADQTWPYYAALTVATGHLAWQVYGTRYNQPADCMRTFRSNQWLGVVIFVGICAGNTLKWYNQRSNGEKQNNNERNFAGFEEKKN